jgi:hypothetical protein
LRSSVQSEVERRNNRMKDTFYKQVSHLEPHMQKLFHCCKAPWTSLELVAIPEASQFNTLNVT